ncbi:hypothetical protein QAD02_010235 [Eretmocerus hayati]|uniref:Uncharacterized protein n=1 Tax=Eretmocerus hayati TaxID=131215 RepID=A0ACC2NBX3_9HYME|nr:hypothetical protein QAD02_010235 [Eretmocerus hayati]
MALELGGSGSKLGYRSLWQRLRKVYHLKVKQKHVLGLLREMDPDGIEARRRYKLRHREYHAEGPNARWHGDNHDKIKIFGFPIYGIIDGYSRKVLSLRVASTNNRPQVIGS